MEMVLEQLSDNPFAESFALQISLPLTHTLYRKKLSKLEQDNLHKLNNTLLDIILAPSLENCDVDEYDAVLLKQLRLTDAKLELALTWLSRLISAETQMPPLTTMEINTIGIRFDSEQAINFDDMLQIRIYVDTQLAEPVTLESTVINVEDKTIIARFVDMDIDVKDKLDKYIFREHRRVIAIEKQCRSAAAQGQHTDVK